MSAYTVTACYHFVDLAHEDLDALKQDLLAIGEQHALRGHVLIAPEGINGTVCAGAQSIQAWKDLLRERFGAQTFKDATVDEPAFRRWSVRIKPEIVGLKRTDIRPAGSRNHLSPAEWNAMLQREDVVVLDTRNDYEYRVGAFRDAINPGIKRFSDFPQYVEQCDIPRDKTVLMYCTGGIRCEKALIAMQEQGYEHVYQLEGGILAYLAACPHQAFQGECFVFDDRTAVDQHLQPSSTFGICPHCGLPGTVRCDCDHCGSPAILCADCAAKSGNRLCSKQCVSERRGVKVG